MSQALAGEYNAEEINVLLDHHIDFYPIETEVMYRWELKNDVVSNVYLFNQFDDSDTIQRRLWTVEDLNIPFYQHLEDSGFEIGYHQNALGLVRNKRAGRIYSQDILPEDRHAAWRIFARDIDNLRRYFKIRTLIPHGAGEGNAQLVDLPDGYDDVVWVYNNAKRNGTRNLPLQWKNYSDSSGSTSQRLSGYKGQYVAQIDNLHVQAYLLEPGFDQILVHPGRFAKGMPYELYQTRNQKEVTLQITRQEFSDVRGNLPLRNTTLMKNWAPGEIPAKPIGETRERKYYVISDDLDLLKTHLGSSDYVIPFHVHHRKMDKREKALLQVPRSTNSTYHTPKSGEKFPEAFRKFYNDIYTAHVLLHLSECGLLLDVLYLQDIRLERFKGLDELRKVLDRLSDDAAVSSRIRSSSITKNKFDQVLGDYFNNKENAKRFTCKTQEVKGEFEIEICANITLCSENSKNVPPASGGMTVSPTISNPINGLSTEELQKLNRLCEARGEDRATVLCRFSLDDVRKAPRSYSKHMAALRNTTFTEAGVRDELAYVILPNGRIFYGHPSRANHRRAYAYVRDIVPSVINEDTYLLSLDIAQRYATDFTWPPEDILPPPSGTLVECGAYLGHKTIRFADELVGSTGKVLAIEMMPDNIEILRRNVFENGSDKIIDVVEAGVWHSPGTLSVRGKGRQRNTLLATGKNTRR